MSFSALPVRDEPRVVFTEYTSWCALEGGPSIAIETHAVVPAALCRSFTPYAPSQRIDAGFKYLAPRE